MERMTVEGVDRHDVRYPDLVQGNNLRWVGAPDKVYLPRDAAEVAACVRKPTGKGRRFTVRSGGHCNEDHVFNSAVRAVVDLGLPRQVEYDPVTGCIAAGPGESLWDVYYELHRRWGTTIPGGSCATVGAGGHIVGGGYGWLSRRDRTPAHQLLPRAPRRVLLHDITIGWDQVGGDGADLAVTLRRFSDWCVHNPDPDSGAANQPFALFRVFPAHGARAGHPPDHPGRHRRRRSRQPPPRPGNAQGLPRLDPHRVLRRHPPAGRLQVGLPPPPRTATRLDSTRLDHQDPVHELLEQAAQDDDHIRWLRDAYTDIYAETGGLPAAANNDPDNTATDGCFVNYLDADLPAHPTTTAASWWQLYYGDTNFARLVRAKHHVDPATCSTTSSPYPPRSPMHLRLRAGETSRLARPRPPPAHMPVRRSSRPPPAGPGTLGARRSLTTRPPGTNRGCSPPRLGGGEHLVGQLAGRCSWSGAVAGQEVVSRRSTAGWPHRCRSTGALRPRGRCRSCSCPGRGRCAG